MTATLFSLPTVLEDDLAGPWQASFSPRLANQRIAALTRRYVTVEHLSDRLADLPHQFQDPQPRRWNPVNWADIFPDQISGIALETFCAILLGTINTEAPIRGYTQASRQYLEHFYPQMAEFVGGTVDAAGVIKPGLWEREEKRHTPVLTMLYNRLSGERPHAVPHRARPYTPSSNPRADLYRHGLHRIATEYGAACLYLWMMAYTTGPLQAALGELLIDEINHMTKFWGFGRWAYPNTGLGMMAGTLTHAMVKKWRQPHLQGSLVHTLRRMTAELAWEQWSLNHQITFLYTFDQVMRVLWTWNRSLTQPYLEELFGQHPSNG
ncbi:MULTISPECIES: ferritin-like domain-containing protein [Cyanophyceae]|uniref:ferritin-like domain-containing protein n=1 Tax=Cyanophyceae TaxID=3028117 RepID=UPI001682E0F6|nr:MULTISPECIES: ferritin-like domain-containing protein [Cyanophyceae]MBD1914625.1 ferritin-like domain-containing protein [Phormidium sp. FACHB-77]MBD2030996.1 ferritin-like domain-containing protein [Phormidium sp. FACHB-322]MBD2052603.1 ferritin-like domain-containing protein [Leptolyngbya sp. FACHB-60]